jgi:tetratricopeptide (TPR) repeat protein
MKLRLSILFVALCCVWISGCKEKTPAQKALAVDAKGRDLVLKGDYGQAITLYTQAITDDGSNGAVYFHRGTARMLDASSGGASVLDDAISDFNMAIRLDPNVRRSAYRARGDAKHLKGDDAGAKEDWEIGDKLKQ